MPKENKAEKDPRAKFRYEDTEVFKVDIVGSPSTGDKFLTIRSDGGGKVPRRAMTKAAVEAFSEEGLTNSAPSIPVVARQEGVNVIIEGGDVITERQVPPADATSEKKRNAQKKRAEKYGIEAWENKGENLSYPEGDPTTERLFADPVNLKYPLGYDDNKLDPDRANNARARFKQSFARYEKTKSRKVIHTRIVEAQLKAGANPDYNPDDANDKLLPKEVVDKMQKPVERAGEENYESEEVEMSTEKLEEIIDTKLDGFIERMEGVFSNILNLGQGQSNEATMSEPEKDDEKEETPEAKGEKATQEPSQSAAPESGSQESEGSPAPGATSEPETSQEAPNEGEQAATPSPSEQPAPASAESVEKLTSAVERMAGVIEANFAKVGEMLKSANERVDGVERSIRSGGNAAEGTTEGPTERDSGNNKPTLFSNIL